MTVVQFTGLNRRQPDTDVREELIAQHADHICGMLENPRMGCEHWQLVNDGFKLGYYALAGVHRATAHLMMQLPSRELFALGKTLSMEQAKYVAQCSTQFNNKTRGTIAVTPELVIETQQKLNDLKQQAYRPVHVAKANDLAVA